MDRREFLKLAAYAGLGATLLPGCGKQAPSPGTALPGAAAIPEKKTSIFANDLVIVQGSEPERLLTRGIDALGGIGRFVKPGSSVVLKPNFSVPRLPEEAATTNIFLVSGMVKMCLAAGAKEVKVIDYPFSNPAICLEKTGMKKAVSAAGGRIYTLNQERDRYFSPVAVSGKLLSQVEFSTDVLKADVFINMPILKHHSGTKLTMGLKNMMGLIWDRGSFHTGNLEQAIAELASVRKPDLTILDALRGITANGPMGPGPIKEYHQLIMGGDPVAVDAYGATLFGMKPSDLEYLRLAAELGVGQLGWEKLNVKRI